MEQADSSDDGDEDMAPMQRSRAGRRAHVISEAEDESPVKLPSNKRLRSGDAALPKPAADDSDDDSDWDVTARRAGAVRRSCLTGCTTHGHDCHGHAFILRSCIACSSAHRAFDLVSFRERGTKAKVC
jgi:hypothetical protein